MVAAAPAGPGLAVAAAGARARTHVQGLRTLPEQIAERIYGAIVGGRHQPGERIREEELAQRFGVSRGPIREALRILERDSVVRVVPNRGAHVTPLSSGELNEIFEIRRVLAGAMVRRLGTAAPELLAELEQRVAHLEATASAPDAAAYVAASVDLSLVLSRASGNERLAQIMSSLARQSWRYTQLSLNAPRRRRESSRNWRVLVLALSRGEGERAGQAMEKLVEDSQREALRLLALAPAAAPGRHVSKSNHRKAYHEQT